MVTQIFRIIVFFDHAIVAEQSILMEVFGFVFGDDVPQIQNADVTAQFIGFSVRCQKVDGQSHYYYSEVCGDIEVSKAHK